MKAKNSSPIVFENLEGRSLYSATPIAAPAPVTHTALHPAALTAKPAATSISLAKYVAGTWEDTIGDFYGVIMQYRTIDSANGQYLSEVNFRYNAIGLPIQTKWTVLDYGTWKAETPNIAPGGTGVIISRSHTGVFSDIYVHPDSANIADFGGLPTGTEDIFNAVWITAGRLV